MVGQQLTALAVANGRYWLTVHSVVRRELRRWREQAGRLDDERRTLALAKLDDAGAHALITATLATLTPRQYREEATVAIVALEVMYDYLDALTEHGVELREGRELYGALADALTGGTPADPYLAALASACSTAIGSLPAADRIVPTALDVARRCGEAQIRSHLAVANAGQLRTWALANPIAGLRWWESAAGIAASILAVHALIAAAGDDTTTAVGARSLADAYLIACALTTMLDSLLDRDADATSGAHSYVAYYARAELAARLPNLALEATRAMRAQRHAAHHSVTIAGIAAYYLSDPCARHVDGDATAAVRASLSPTITPALAVFHAWRTSSRLRH